MIADCPQNVVLLTVDALRADHLGCYGYDRNTSPHLDGLAEESIRFMNTYSASSHTREAVPALLTGRFPDAAIDAQYHLDADTIASYLSRGGFATGAFHSNPYVSRAYRYDSDFDKFDDDLYLGKHKLVALAQRALDKLRNRHYTRAEKINRRSLDWLDSLPSDRGFFLWNHYMDPHGPYEPLEKYRKLFHDEPVSNREAQKLYKRAIRNPESITPLERETLVNLYDAEIRYTDEHIQRFLNALEERNIREETLVIITADHGDAFGEHGYYEHPRYLDDELLCVPLIVKHPDPSPLVVDVPTSTVDIVPTILDTLGRSSADFPGTSLFDIADTVDTFTNRVTFAVARGDKDNSHLYRFAARHRDATATLVRNTGGTIIETNGPANLLSDLRQFSEGRTKVDYNLEDDPAEAGEVADRLRSLGYRE